ncbi:MAG: hypothetical protein JW809_05935 [Pirellulales bacterium]|nr:hypothetical protein [Pirellulales bacterium]
MRAAAIAGWAIVAIAAGASLARVELPEAESRASIAVSADWAQRWMQGSYEVWVLRGNCRIQQGLDVAQSKEAVLWVDRSGPIPPEGQNVIAYLEGDVLIRREVERQNVTLTDETWFGRLRGNGVMTRIAQVAGPPEVPPAIYRRGMARRMPEVSRAIRHTQYTQLDTPPEPVAPGTPTGATRRIRILPRGNSRMQADWTPGPTGRDAIGVINSGVNLIVDGLPGWGTIDVETDRLVIWTVGPDELRARNEALQSEDLPLEIYMEGNIVFRQEQRVVYADRMYYDVRRNVGMILGAEMLTPVRKFEGLLRLRSEILHQTDANHYFAQNGFVTSSRMGKPGYRAQIGDVEVEDFQRPVFDPVSGEQVGTEADQRVTGRNTFLFLEDLPLFYWPIVSTTLEEPTFFIRRAVFRNDRVFGTQILTKWDGYQLLGVKNKPEGTDLDLTLDYLSYRGFGHGASMRYNRTGLLRVPGRNAGLVDYWGIKDHGHDNLGRDRRNLMPEKSYRHRLFWQHRQELTSDWRVSAEVGWISDRNFLEQYYEREWDELKDEATGVEFKRRADNTTWSITADTRLNEFFTQTEWYPRADHYWLGQPLFGDALTWHEHSQAGYGRYRILSTPENQADQDVFAPLPWEIAAKGERLVTTHELDWPLQFGPVKTVPYALGQLAHWGEDLTGESLNRAYWQAGMRASLPMWRADPSIESALWNVHGLAHKIVFDAEFSVAEANRDVERLPLYDALDDDSVEAFRRRLAFLTFGTPTTPVTPQYPAQFDPRYYALRSGLAGWVTSPSAEVLDDMMALRLGMRQRWQTKRGMPGSRHILDWVTFDTGVVWFPNPDRDNFGTALGLANYDFRWHIGDRLTLVSDGLFDFFDEGQQIVTLGGFLSRPPRGNLYLGVRFLEGPISSHVLTTSYSYRMSPKWISAFGMSVDLRDGGNVGQRLAITRVGEALLFSVGFNIDATRGNYGATFMMEPRFLPKSRLARAGGAYVPVAGAYGLE